MSPFGPFYCVFRWDLAKFDYPGPKQFEDLRIRFASEKEFGSVAKVWYEGLSEEEGSPWTSYLKRWTPASAAKWFLDSRKRLGARMLVAEKEEKIVGVNGIICERNSSKGRFFTGIVVLPSYRRQGIGSLILHKTLSDLKAEGLPNHGSRNNSRDSGSEISLSKIWRDDCPSSCLANCCADLLYESDM